MPLTALVVGGGIAGLSAAIALRRAGHTVHIYERSAFLNEVGAAIHVPPNATRALLGWGLDPARARLVRARRHFLASGHTLEKVDERSLEDVEARYGAPWFLAHRVDLHEELKRLATGDAGVGTPATVHMKCDVVAYDPDTPSLTLADGSRVVADAHLIVAADGVHSLAAEAVLGHANPAVPPGGDNFCYRFLIPNDVIAADPLTRFWVDGDDDDGRVKFLVDPAKRIVSYPCRNNEVQNLIAIFHNNDPSSIKKEDWHASLDKSKLLETFADFHPTALAILDKATEVKQWALLYRAPIPTWTKGKMALAGDAAHPMLPHQGQGGAQAVEDGVALGIALAGAAVGPEQVPERLAVYEKIRRHRASAVQIFSNAGQDEAHKILAEASRFMPADKIPNDQAGFFDFNFGYDVITDSVDKVREMIDPSFVLPEDFFDRKTAGQ